MDELDKLKNHWQKSEAAFTQVSEKEIYGMLHKKSSSVVKWILILSIVEFAFWLLLSFFLKDNPNAKRVENFHMDYITIPMSCISYGIIIYFFFIFYKNYKKITATDNVKNLMASILKTRKTVSNYIFVNILYVIVCSIVLFAMYFYNDEQLINAFQQSEAHGNVVSFYIMYIVMAVVTIGILILIVWLFYKLVYGFLLKRLYRNYEELKKIDF